MRCSRSAVLVCALVCAPWGARAQDAKPSASMLLVDRDISVDLARQIADSAIEACRAMGFEVSVTVVGRDGLTKLAIRGDHSAPHNFELSRRKAYTARTFRRTSASWAKRMTDEPELSGQKMLREVIPLGGAFPSTWAPRRSAASASAVRRVRTRTRPALRPASRASPQR